MRLLTPIARQEGGPIRGLVRSDFVVQDRVYDRLLSDRNHIPYPVADPDAPETVMTVRDRVESQRRVIPRSQWRFGRMENGRVVPDMGRVHLEGGFVPGKIYEVVYVSENPPLVGLGPTAIRDFVSHLKYEGDDDLSIPADALDRALGFGISQSGRFLRTFLYYGFNEDEKHRIVFDGLISHVAGGGRGSFNHRFAQPSRDAHPFMNFFYPTDIFPFTDVEQHDPETGLRDGILTHRLARKFWPKVFYTNSSYEYWGRAASLIHTTIDGREDIALYDNVRVYMFAGTQHGPAGFPPRVTMGQQLSNPMDFRWSMRALLKAMTRWAADDGEPPPSQYPLRKDGTLVRADDLMFPKIPGVGFSSRVHKAYRADYGPKFYSRGIVSKEPPDIEKAFPILVSAVDRDGNEIAGVRMPEQEVPLATYAGWNLFNEKSGPIGRNIQHARLLHSVRQNRVRAQGEWGSPAVDRNALQEPRRVSRPRCRRRHQADRGRLPAGQGPAHHRQARRTPLGLLDEVRSGADKRATAALVDRRRTRRYLSRAVKWTVNSPQCEPTACLSAFPPTDQPDCTGAPDLRQPGSREIAASPRTDP